MTRTLLVVGLLSAVVAPADTCASPSYVGDTQLRCMAEAEKGIPRVVARTRVRAPKRVKYVAPVLPDGLVGSGMWVGEVLIDTSGRVTKTWTVKQPTLTPP